MGEPGRGSFARDPEGYEEKGSGDGYHSPWEPCWGDCKGARPTGDM